jgi:PAS domain-containing protein
LRARDSLATEVALQTQKLQDRNQALRAQIERVLKSERAQRQAETRLRAIADSIPAMIGYWNRELRCEFANEAYKGWFHVAPEENHRHVDAKTLGSGIVREKRIQRPWRSRW